MGVPRELDPTTCGEYVVGPGDGLLVIAVNLDSAARVPSDQTVLPDGTIDLGQYGPLQAAGKTLAQIEAEVNQRLEHAMKRNYRIIRDISRNQSRRSDTHDSRPFCIGKEVDPRCAAMILALKRIEAHYLLEGFSQ